MQTNLSNQTAKYNSQEFLVGDTVVCVSERHTDRLFTVIAYQPTDHYWLDCNSLAYKSDIRTATVAELNAKRRLTSAEQALAEVS